MQSLPVIHITADNHYDVGRGIGSTFKADNHYDVGRSVGSTFKADNHYDAGRGIGSTFKAFISDYINTSKDVELFRQFYDDQKGRQIYEQYVQTSEAYFPEIVDEIRGIADGAGQNFVDIYLLQLASEIRMSHQFELPELRVNAPDGDKGCTDILCNTKSFRLMAHNDDWSDEVSERVYFAHVTITNNGGSNSQVKEQFMAYTYPGYLFGFCFGMNSDLVFTLNTVRPITANRKGVPLAILLRKLLTCQTIDECAAIMENRPVGCAFGMNINIADVHCDVMCSLEAYPETLSTRVSVHNVENGQYCHTNYYQHTTNVKESPREGTFRRDKRAREMMSQPLANVDDVLRVLGDTTDDLEPIYRTPSERHLIKTSKTSATAVFDFSKRKLFVYRMNPKLARSPCYSTDFL